MILQPTTVDELQDIIRNHERLILRGRGSKPALSTPLNDTACLDMSQLSGIIEYEPGEYTFTAYAGTPLQDIADTLAEHGQYMPFDPLLVKKGATLGGTVAANLSGSGRWRFGGVRDFILGVRFVDGQGRYVRGGGKVVKNAAGFDLPKFFVGSLGQYGALVELSFKVFPQPATYQTLKLTYNNLSQVIDVLFALVTSPLETDAIDIEPKADEVHILIRRGGLAAALPGRIERLKNFLQKNGTFEAVEIISDDSDLWQAVNNLAWGSGKSHVLKIPLAPRQVVELDARLATIGTVRRYTAAGNVAWVALDDVTPLETVLNQQQLVGLKILGAAGSPYIGNLKGQAILQRMKQVLDPHGKFGGVDAAQY